jgi:hypothetical protein
VMNKHHVLWSSMKPGVVMKALWGDEGKPCFLTFGNALPPYRAPYYCGYAAFAGETVLDDATLETVEVHGGVTGAWKFEGFALYQFDCNHEGDHRSLYTQDIAWLMGQTNAMAAQLEAIYANAERKALGGE